MSRYFGFPFLAHVAEPHRTFIATTASVLAARLHGDLKEPSMPARLHSMYRTFILSDDARRAFSMIRTNAP